MTDCSWFVVCRGFVIVVFFLAGHLTEAGLAAEADSGLAIGSIATAGNCVVSRSQILARVRSREGEVFDAGRAAEDARRIAELGAVGYCYYSTAVVEGKVELTFVVAERNMVRSIDFEGNRRVKDKVLRKQVGMKEEDYVDLVLAESGREALESYYRGKGYTFAEVAVDRERLESGQLLYEIKEGPRVKIDSVDFRGNEAIGDSELRGVLKTKERKWFIWSSYYVTETVEADVVRLANVYYKRGFLDARVNVEKLFTLAKDKAKVIFVVEEGPVYRVEQIVFEGNKYFGDGRLRERLGLREGQVYSEQRAEQDRRNLVKIYRENGFVEAGVRYERRFVSGNAVRLIFWVTEGERFRIGRVQISGNEQTQDKVVRRVLDEYDFQPGRWYNADMARGDGSGSLEKRLRRMVLAESATIKAAGEAEGQRDAEVSIVEGQTGSVMLGAGVASDSGVIGQLVFEQRNFDISDRPESLWELITGRAFKGAGQRLRIALQPGTEVSEYSVSFTEPYFRDRPTSLDVIGSSYERWRESFDEQRTKGYVGFEKRYKDGWRRRIAFRLENVEVNRIDDDAPREITDVEGDNVLGGVKLGFGRDTTDDTFNPTAGYRFNVSYEQIGGDYTFGVLSGTHRWYKTLKEDLAERKTVLATKLHAATALGDAPPFEKFYAGGQGSLRGFDYRGVSTRGLQQNVAMPQRKDPIGSDWIFLANTELTVPLVGENLSALFFVDSGMIDTGGYRAAVGTGIQILIPRWFGPVPMRFELAAPFLKNDEDKTQVFSFSVGRLF